MTVPARFTQADLVRAIEGVKKAGLPVSGARIDPDGSITILTTVGLPANDRNPLDRVLGR